MSDFNNKLVIDLFEERDALKADVVRLTLKVAELYKGAEEQTQRIKRLEEALDTLTCVIGLTPIKSNREAFQEAFDMARTVLKAKEGLL